MALEELNEMSPLLMLLATPQLQGFVGFVHARFVHARLDKDTKEIKLQK